MGTPPLDPLLAGHSVKKIKCLSVKHDCSLNAHRKSSRNVLGVFDVCWELLSDCSNYSALVVEEFSGRPRNVPSSLTVGIFVYSRP